jgi:threonine aldolase
MVMMIMSSLTIAAVAAAVVEIASALSTTPTTTTLSSSSSYGSLAPLPRQQQSQHKPPPLFSLQDAHAPSSPSEVLRELASACNGKNNNAEFSDKWDVYGDFDKDANESFLRRFEAEISNEFGFQDAVFMPSGVMAQSIALLIHAKNNKNHPDGASTSGGTTKKNKANTVRHFICHHSSHLLLHEQDAYRELLNMNAIVVDTTDKAELNHHPHHGIISIVPAMRFEDVKERMNSWRLEQETAAAISSDNDDDVDDVIAALILEVPHRELGGKMTPWNDIVQMRDYCQEHGIAFHCDGARIFEATTAALDNSGSPRENLVAMARLFDSMYISFYKGLGGISGAMLLGTSDFCQEARVWLRRFGGNIYTLLPYYMSAWLGYQRQWKLHSSSSSSPSKSLRTNNIPALALSFEQKKQKLVRLVAALSADPVISRIVSFDPPIPETNMVHGYVHQPPNDDVGDADDSSSLSVETCRAICNAIQDETGIRVLTRMREVNITTTTTSSYSSNSNDGQQQHHHPMQQQQQQRGCCKFEWSMGEANGNIPDEIYRQGWTRFAEAILKRNNE